VLAPDRIADLLNSLIERQAAKSESADHRLLALQKELSDADDRLKLEAALPLQRRGHRRTG
jgi:site-specific DNA recombinase